MKTVQICLLKLNILKVLKLIHNFAAYACVVTLGGLVEIDPISTDRIVKIF